MKKNNNIDADCTFEKKKWISITGLCNNNCQFCLDKDRPDKSHKDTCQIKKEIKEAKEQGNTKLILSGGDPTIHPDLIDFVKYAKDLGYNKIQVITNGRMFASKKFTDAIIDAGLDEVTFSIHGYTQDMHDSLTCVPGSFRQVLRGVKNVFSNPKAMIVNTDTCITRSNYKQLPKIIRFIVEKVGINEVNLMSMVPQGNAWKYQDKILYDYKEVASYVHKVIDYCTAKHVVLWLSRFPAMYLEGYEEFIEDPYKMVDDVRGCCNDVFLNKQIPECLGGKCKYCGINSICPTIQALNESFMNIKESGDIRNIQDNCNAEEQGKNAAGFEKITITRQNYEKLPEMTKGKNKIIFEFEAPGYSLNEYKSKVPQFTEIKSYLAEAVKNVRLWKTKNIPPCIFLTRNIEKQTYLLKKEYVKDGKLDYVNIAKDICCKTKIKREICAVCPLNEECEGFFQNYARIFGFSEFDPANIETGILKPREIRINLECNQRCSFCNTDENANDLILDHDKILKAIKENKSLYLIISGKEPTLNKNILKYIKLAKEEGCHKIEIQTNAVKCAAASFVKDLSDAGLTDAFVSLHAHESGISDRITCAPGTFEKTIEGIRNLALNDIGLSINIVINSINYKILPEHARFIVEDLGVTKIVFSFASPVCSALKNPSIIPKISDVIPYLKTAMDYLIKKDISFCIPGRCGIPLCFLQGYENFCDEYNEPERWRDCEDKIKLSSCQGCILDNICNGIWQEYINIHGEDEFKNQVIKAAGKKHIEVNLGKRCNNNCIFCMVPQESLFREFADCEKIKKEIKKYFEDGYNSIGFVGGEPTIYPNIVEIISYAKSLGYKEINIVTNCKKFSDKNFLKSLLEAGLNRIVISAHSHIETIGDRLSGIAGSHRQKMKGILNVVNMQKSRKHSFSAALTFIISRLNIDSLASSVDFFMKLGFNDFRINSINPAGNALENFNSVVPKFVEIPNALKEIVSLAQEQGDVHLSFGDIPLCIINKIPALKKFASGKEDHIDSVCSFSDSSLKQEILWVQDRKDNLKSKLDICSRCRYACDCEGIWKNYLKKYGEEEFGIR